MSSLLIIDDEEDLREVLSAILAECAEEIVTAKDGLEACEILATRTFTAILSDQKMPRRTGMEVLKWLRERNDSTPFIIHTGFGNAEMLSEARNLGVFAFVDKPWDEGSLVSTIERALGKRLNEQQLP